MDPLISLSNNAALPVDGAAAPKEKALNLSVEKLSTACSGAFGSSLSRPSPGLGKRVRRLKGAASAAAAGDAGEDRAARHRRRSSSAFDLSPANIAELRALSQEIGREPEGDSALFSWFTPVTQLTPTRTPTAQELKARKVIESKMQQIQQDLHDVSAVCSLIKCADFSIAGEIDVYKTLLLLERGHLADAKKCIDQLIQRDPECFSMLGSSILRDIAERQRMLDEAQVLFDEKCRALSQH